MMTNRILGAALVLSLVGNVALLIPRVDTADYLASQERYIDELLATSCVLYALSAEGEQDLATLCEAHPAQCESFAGSDDVYAGLVAERDGTLALIDQGLLEACRDMGFTAVDWWPIVDGDP